jgi:hypothetical protein
MKVYFRNIISFLFIFTLIQGSGINMIFSFIDPTQTTIELDIPAASAQETEVINETLHEVVCTEPADLHASSLLIEQLNKKKFKSLPSFYSWLPPSIPLPPPEQNV